MGQRTRRVKTESPSPAAVRDRVTFRGRCPRCRPPSVARVGLPLQQLPQSANEMPTRIRLRRMGRKKKAHYRVVVADSRSPRDGRCVDTIGHYKPYSDPAHLVLDLEAVDAWIERGAQPSNTVRSLIRKARRGGDAKVALGTPSTEEPTEPADERGATRAERLAEESARRAATEADEASSGETDQEDASAG